MIEIRNLRKRLGKKEILQKITLTLNPWIIGLLGANGAGKIALLHCLTGVYGSDRGKISYRGENISKSKSCRLQLGYLPQALACSGNLPFTR